MPTSRRLRDDGGGPHLLSTRGLLVAVPFVLVTSVATSAAPDLETWGLWFVVNVGAIAAAGPVVLVWRTVFRRLWRKGVPLAMAVGAGATVGAAKGLATTALGAAVDLIERPWADALGRGLNTGVIGAVLIPVLAMLTAARDRWETEREVLVMELARRRFQQNGGVESSHRHTLQALVQRTLSNLVQQSPEQWPTTLRAMVDGELRPLSADALAASQPAPPRSAWTLVQSALVREPLRVATIAAVFAVSSAGPLLRYAPVTTALAYGALLTVLTAAALGMAQGLRQRWPSRSPLILVVCIVAVALAIRPLGHAFVGVVAELDHVGVTLTTAVWLAELVVASTVIAAARRERAELRDRLLLLVGPGGVHRAVDHGATALQNREFAFFVHGHLQNRLLALADQLDRGEQSHHTRQQVVETLRSVHTGQSVTEPLSDRLNEIALRWRGLADIVVPSPVQLEQVPAVTADEVAHVVVEAVNNAVRHGAARSVVVDIQQADQRWVITVVDDGLGPRRGRRGVGSRYFDLVADGDWSLTPAPSGGSLLRVTLSDAAARGR